MVHNHHHHPREGKNRTLAHEDSNGNCCISLPCLGGSCCCSICTPDNDDGSGSGKPRKMPMKVEPKTFFANERTYLKWVHIAVTLGGIGGILLGFSSSSKYHMSHNDDNASLYSGATLNHSRYALASWLRIEGGASGSYSSSPSLDSEATLVLGGFSLWAAMVSRKAASLCSAAPSRAVIP